ncbi:hypothetical protein A2954_05430 [Candidatus Roizmanbacteria bacterium RIFCSPLOWO2_01_FULL_37_12]|uniref:Uncharacterized protein n=1 Tax=Candidatus Roizmanbacteria bacterium RIFCSPLOWO2_01_FULL_37_12 TaxID=1802056 RepID=A0A1F7I919_9BACT|nr:MAG: hypothetical protein A3D76_04645 [Candidatus Roizmanbacteria bacterium RIFCSPHIGHO2_02_FULL_37_9b]OGK39865.1 MAG: hypothetical protein A2954_05430 [Candidatus Roizmanbacteria bacterium RIFCSPLOWO2_01_FULL_37_12]
MKIDPSIFSELKLFFNERANPSAGKLSVVSAYTLSQTEKELILVSLIRLGYKTDEVDYQINKNILAGIILKVGTTVIDLSLRGQLTTLKNELYEST